MSTGTKDGKTTIDLGNNGGTGSTAATERGAISSALEDAKTSSGSGYYDSASDYFTGTGKYLDESGNVMDKYSDTWGDSWFTDFQANGTKDDWKRFVQSDQMSQYYGDFFDEDGNFLDDVFSEWFDKSKAENVINNMFEEDSTDMLGRIFGTDNATAAITAEQLSNFLAGNGYGGEMFDDESWYYNEDGTLNLDNIQTASQGLDQLFMGNWINGFGSDTSGMDDMALANYYDPWGSGTGLGFGYDTGLNQALMDSNVKITQEDMGSLWDHLNSLLTTGHWNANKYNLSYIGDDGVEHALSLAGPGDSQIYFDEDMAMPGFLRGLTYDDLMGTAAAGNSGLQALPAEYLAANPEFAYIYQDSYTGTGVNGFYNDLLQGLIDPRLLVYSY